MGAIVDLLHVFWSIWLGCGVRVSWVVPPSKAALLVYWVQCSGINGPWYCP